MSRTCLESVVAKLLLAFELLQTQLRWATEISLEERRVEAGRDWRLMEQANTMLNDLENSLFVQFKTRFKRTSKTTSAAFRALAAAAHVTPTAGSVSDYGENPGYIPI